MPPPYAIGGSVDIRCLDGRGGARVGGSGGGGGGGGREGRGDVLDVRVLSGLSHSRYMGFLTEVLIRR